MTIPIVALDYPDADQAMAMVSRLGDGCSWYKVGSELFTASGPAVVERLRSLEKSVFLDLKFHDIPSTVRAAARSARRAGASLATVHAVGGRAMVEAAVEGAGDECRVLAVTVLTSLDASALGEGLGHGVSDVAAEASRLARIARAAGAHGVVCSGHEVTRIRSEHAGALATLVPGVRLEGDPANDQSRVVTPGVAARAGADYVVLGRTVTASPDPALAMARVVEQLSV